MSDLKDESYLFLCFGKQYIDDAIDFIDTLRHFNDHRPVNIVVHKEDIEYAEYKKQFNKIISFNVYDDPLIDLCTTNFEKFCLLPRLRLNTFLLTKYTLVLDTDILCGYHTNHIWEFFINKKQPLIMVGSKHNESWHWGSWGKVCEQIKTSPYETHGGLFFVDNEKPELLTQIWEYAIYAFKNFDDLGFLRWYQNGAVDEPCFAYAFDKSNLQPINFSEFPIMTFNIDASSTDIPTKIMTECFQSCIMNQPIPFIHMFEKNRSTNFKLLKEKILNVNIEE